MYLSFYFVVKSGKWGIRNSRPTEEELDDIRPICAVAEKYAPNYDVEAIYNELH